MIKRRIRVNSRQDEAVIFSKLIRSYHPCLLILVHFPHLAPMIPYRVYNQFNWCHHRLLTLAYASVYGARTWCSTLLGVLEVLGVQEHKGV